MFLHSFPNIYNKYQITLKNHKISLIFYSINFYFCISMIKFLFSSYYIYNSPMFQSLPQVTETDIMEMLHKKKMYFIEKCFQQKQKGLTKQEFVKVMLEYLEYDKTNKDYHLSVTLALIQLFKEIDVNGDGTMEWEEFSNHIIELGLQRNDRGLKNLIKCYQHSEAMVDREKHDSELYIVQYVEKLRMLFSVENQCSKFKVYDANSGNFIYEVKAHKNNILCLQYLSNQNLLASSSNDMSINFWDPSTFALKHTITTPQIQLCMRYADWKSSGAQMLYTGGPDSVIHIYNANTFEYRGNIPAWNPNSNFKNDSQTGHNHESPIGDILAIDSQQALVTAGYDANICLWDSITHLLKKQLKGHKKGVYSLDWCNWSQMNQCLLSAGLDHEAFVWNTYVKEKIFLLRGHNSPLVGVKCLPDTPQIITADISGMVKVWDVRTFLCMQTFNVPADELSTFCLTYSTNPSFNIKKRIVTAFKKMHYFEYDQPKDQFLTDQKVCLKVLFNKTLSCFITLHPDSLKIWSSKQGTLQSVYRGLSTFELTTMVLDYRQRKLFVGDLDGNIFTVNIKNGVRMKSFQKHETMVTGLCHWTNDSHNEYADSEKNHDQRRLIVSISKKSNVHIHDEDSPEDVQSSIRYIMRQHKDACNSVAIRKGTELLASSSDDGTIILTNLLTYRQEILHNPEGNEVKKLLFLGSHNLLAAADSFGNILFFGVGQTKYRNKLVLIKKYKTLSLTNKQQVFPITAFNFYEKERLLVMGDEFGNIEAWDLSELLRQIAQSRLIEKKNSFIKKKVTNDRPSQFLTEINKIIMSNILEQQFLSEEIVKSSFKIKKAHLDGITDIEMIEEFGAFATSSFDCCCFIWSIDSYKKIGSLIIGGDKNWKLVISESERKAHAVTEAKQILVKISNNDMFVPNSEDDGTSRKKKIQFDSRKAASISNAKSLIEKQRKLGMMSQDKSLVEESQLRINDSEDDDYMEDYESKQYHLMEDVMDFKKKDGGMPTMKNSNLYRTSSKKLKK